ncbi:MAG: phosphotransferase family protein [Sporolactobacillus sp.]
MRFFDSEEWRISSAGGMTGEAYLAESGEHKLFIKRNSSPFLAVLSAEGIVPKLLWTRRMSNGDVLTAQTWTKGRVLRPNEMDSQQVADMLKKIHHSEPLLLMMRRIGKRPVSTKQILSQLQERAKGRTETAALQTALAFLKRTAADAETATKTVCHSDVNHNNWLLDTESGSLYLVDWDQAVIADPVIDLAMLLYWYVAKDQWEAWLAHYGWQMNDDLQLRLVWHMIAMTVRFMFWHQEHAEVRKMILFEKDLLWLNDYAARLFLR